MNQGRSEFERERDRLVSEIAENLAKCVTSVNQLNRSIENVAVVAEGFAPVHHLWKQFEHVMKNTAADTSEQHEFLQPSFPDGTDETALLPSGVAPGGGATVGLSP